MKSNNLDLSIVIDKISKQRSIKKEKIIDVIEDAYLRAAKKKWPEFQFESEYVDGDINLQQIIEINDINNPFHADVGDDLVFDVYLDDEDKQIKLQEKYPSLEFPEVDGSFDRVAINQARNALQDKISGLNKERAYNLYSDQEGELVSGKVRYISDEQIAVDLGKVKAILPYDEIHPRDRIKPKDKISAVIKRINSPDEKEQIILSRKSPKYVEAIMKEEIQELEDGRVEIVDIVRDVGYRSKVAVRSNEKGLSGVGPCIGYNGARINRISDRLFGERIDVIPYSKNKSTYTKNALGIDKCICTEEDDHIKAQVPEEEMSRAIGKKGTNTKLTSKLVEKRIKVEKLNI